MAGDDDRPLRAEEPLGQLPKAVFRWPNARIDSCRLSQINHAEGVEDVSRQGDKDGPGRGSRGDFRGAVHAAGQVFQPCHLGRPFHDGCRDRYQRRVQQRLGQPMSLLLLPGGNDQRRARIERREQGAHRVAEPRGDMHVARNQFTRGTGIAVGHGDNDRLLQAEHVAHVRIIGERMHDRQFGGSRIAEKVRDALGL